MAVAAVYNIEFVLGENSMAKCVCPDCGKRANAEQDNCPRCGAFLTLKPEKPDVAPSVEINIQTEPPAPEVREVAQDTIVVPAVAAADPAQDVLEAEDGEWMRWFRETFPQLAGRKGMQIAFVACAAVVLLVIGVTVALSGSGRSTAGTKPAPYHMAYHAGGAQIALGMGAEEVEEQCGSPIRTEIDDQGRTTRTYAQNIYVVFTDEQVSRIVLTSDQWSAYGGIQSGSSEADVRVVFGEPDVMAENRALYRYTENNQPAADTDQIAYAVFFFYDAATLSTVETIAIMTLEES